MSVITGGDKFTAKMEELAKKLNQPQTLQVGFFENATYPDGTFVAMVAAILNYGAPSRSIPPRPFFSNMVRDKSDKWPDGIATQLVETDYDIQTTLARTGEVIVGQLQDSIANGGWTPNKPSTLRRKHGEQPLVDTGQLLRSPAYRVKPS